MGRQETLERLARVRNRCAAVVTAIERGENPVPFVAFVANLVTVCLIVAGVWVIIHLLGVR